MNGWSGTPFDDDVFDDRLVDHLLDDANEEMVPATCWPLVRVLAAARTPATDAELAGEDEAVAMFRSRPLVPATPLRSHRAKAFLAVSVLAVSSVTGAAAATGNLPDPAQDVASDLLGLVGIDVPRGRERTPEDPIDSSAPSNVRPVASTTVPSMVSELAVGAITNTRIDDRAVPRFAVGPAPAAEADAGPGAPITEAAPTDQPAPPDGLPSDMTDPRNPPPASVPNGPPPTEDDSPPSPPAGDAPPGSRGERPPDAGGGHPPSTPGGSPPHAGGGSPPPGQVGPPPGVGGGPPPPGQSGPPPGLPGGPPPEAGGGPPPDVPGDPPPHPPGGPPAGASNGPPAHVGPPPAAPGGPPPPGGGEGP